MRVKCCKNASTNNFIKKNQPVLFYYNTRFIHDIVTATMESTDFPRGYFNSEELDSRALKNKTSKIAFLEKLVYLVGVCIGLPINVQPAKIVSGLEPLNTNIFLTKFGQVAGNRDVDYNGAIRHCESGGKIGDFPTTQASFVPEVDVPTKHPEEAKSEVYRTTDERDGGIDKEEQARSLKADQFLEQCDKSSRARAVGMGRHENWTRILS